MIRALVAVNLDIGALRRVSEAQRALRARCGEAGWDIKWIAPPHVNVLLRYLGEVDLALASSMEDALQSAAGISPFVLGASGVRVRGGAEAGGTVVAGIDDVEGGLAELRAAVGEPLDEIGFQPEPEGEEPCLVLARIRAAGETPLDELLAEEATTDFGESTVRELVVYRTDGARPGEEFQDLVRLRLSGRPRPRPAAAEDVEDVEEERAAEPALEAPPTPAPNEKDGENGEDLPPDQEE